MQLHLIVPTYHRDAHLQEFLYHCARQTRLPSRIIVVDNAASRSCEEVVRKARDRFQDLVIERVGTHDNLGSAGATAIGMDLLLQTAQDDDWIMRADDDSPPYQPRLFEELVKHANTCRTIDSRTAAVGLSGALYDARWGKLFKPPSDPTKRYVPVDYLATNRFPLYLTGSIREVGVFRRDLFFGFTEVEFGLRLRRALYSMYRVDLPGHTRKERPSRAKYESAPTWRTYYSMRNRIVVAREYGSWPSPLWIIFVTGILKPLANLLHEPRFAAAHLHTNALAIRHALTGRMGRTMEPTLDRGQLGLRASG